MHISLKGEANWSCSPSKTNKKWKLYSLTRMSNKSSLFFLFFLLQLQAFTFRLVSSQGDGVLVTQADYKALRAFKNELIDYRGVLRSWNDSGYGACSGGWVGIKCVKGQVIAIQLPWKTLGGKISENIGALQQLRRLSLHDNLLSGPLPLSLGSLSKLRGVYLFNNRFSGSIPSSIGKSLLLQALDLSNNSFTGEIPPSLGNSKRLLRLNLSHNSLSGLIPSSLTTSPSLTFLSLEHNNLSGSIPDNWNGPENETYQLQFLSLDHNRITGDIPVYIGKLGGLEEISLSHNQLSGIIPSELGRLSKLRLLDLSNNDLNGSFPSTFSNLSSLVSLNLESNRLDKPIPEALDGLKNLSVLNLRNNLFDGQIPETIGNISGISQIDLSDNNFTGNIPASLSGLVNLTSFNVSYNNLSGSVPPLLLKKFNSTSFRGNLQLCGYSSSTPCPPPFSPALLPPSPSEQAAPKRHHDKLSAKDIILIAVGAVLALVLLLLLCLTLLCCLMKRKASGNKRNGETAKQAADVGATEKAVSVTGVGSGEVGGKLVHFDGPFVFTADDLLCATAEIMGKSAYGTAYKATLEDGHEVAVKRLREKTTKGQEEFETEAAELGKIRHQNLLSLRAYYLGPKGEKLLVYDHMPKGTLSSFLHARGPESTIDWGTRMKIAMGITRGLGYLHGQESLSHGNLTSGNILLDEKTKPHIADCGLSRLMTTSANTNVIATAGTQGYNAPELAKNKKPTTKSDIYSLGVIILELLTGKSPVEAMNGMDLPQWVASIVKEEWTNEVFDLELMRDAPVIGDELLNTLKLALHCVDPSAAARPDAQLILQQLEEIKPELASASGDDGAIKLAEPANEQ